MRYAFLWSRNLHIKLKNNFLIIKMKNKKNHRELLEEIYSEAQSMLKKGKGTPVIAGLNDDERQLLESIASHSETNKGVLTVLITSLVHKIFDSKQDIRKHQSNMRGG